MSACVPREQNNREHPNHGTKEQLMTRISWESESKIGFGSLTNDRFDSVHSEVEKAVKISPPSGMVEGNRKSTMVFT